MNLYGYNKEYYATLNYDIMQDYWHKLILPHNNINSIYRRKYKT